MRVEQYCVGDVGTNCYFAINEETGEMLVIDPGDSAGMLAGKIREGGWKPQAVLLTHGHFDHAMAAEELAGMFGIQVYAHEAEGWSGAGIGRHGMQGSAYARAYGGRMLLLFREGEGSL